MRAGVPSLTAMAVAFGRGLGTRGEAPDPLATELLPAPLSSALRIAKRAPGPLRAVLRGLTFGMVDHICLRTAAIDVALERAIVGGCEQLVILGAGLDARAWRIQWLGGVVAFEVDHPSTQRTKREAIANIPPTAESVRFVPVDFEAQRVADRLADEGHDVSRPTAWIWEGVTPYLNLLAIAATLDDIGARSATGSTLMMTYAAGDLAPLPIPGAAGITRAAFRVLGEELRGVMTPPEAAQALNRIGFAVESDTDARNWAAVGDGNPTIACPFRAERLLVARRL
jgi:methyltransferase (TIGR00027 family)